MNQPVKLLLVFAGIYGLIGTVLGAQMAGSGSYDMSPVHAHILVVGWLTLFSWAVFYKVFEVKYHALSKFHVWSAIIGTTGLVIGMYINNVAQFDMPAALTLTVYIGGGVTLLLSFAAFFVQTLLYKPER